MGATACTGSRSLRAGRPVWCGCVTRMTSSVQGRSGMFDAEWLAVAAPGWWPGSVPRRRSATAGAARCQPHRRQGHRDRRLETAAGRRDRAASIVEGPRPVRAGDDEDPGGAARSGALAGLAKAAPAESRLCEALRGLRRPRRRGPAPGHSTSWTTRSRYSTAIAPSPPCPSRSLRSLPGWSAERGGHRRRAAAALSCSPAGAWPRGRLSRAMAGRQASARSPPRRSRQHPNQDEPGSARRIPLAPIPQSPARGPTKPPSYPRPPRRHLAHVPPAAPDSRLRLRRQTRPAPG